jgi:Mg-chelatase subunit ChlD
MGYCAVSLPEGSKMMPRRLLGCFLLAGLLVQSAAADSQRAVVFVLDCSKSMGAPAVSGPIKEVSTGEAPARMELAKQMLVRLLEDAAADNCQVSLWLYGHRVKWQENVREPELVEQNDYLQASVGFNSLNGLLPGDDYEQIFPIKPLGVPDVQELDPRLAAVQAWGERPMYATLTRVLDDVSNLPAGTQKSIVLLTDGGNRQWLAKHKPAHQDVMMALNHQLVPIHILHFGTPDTDEARLKDMAEHGGGSLTHVDAESKVTLAELLANQPAAVAAEKPQAQIDPAKAEAVAAATALLQNKTAEYSVSGTVLFYGKPVTSATVVVPGTDVAPVKTDRQGSFLLRKVPSGKHQIQVNAIAKNAYRDKTIDLTIEASRAPQPLTVEMSIK